jgi:hypothetical protein
MPGMHMARRLAVISAVVIGTGALAPVTSAHHSHPIFYDMCTTVRIEGRITRARWRTPHSLIDVQTDAGMTFHIEWMSAQALRQASAAEDMLTIGTRVAVIAHPHRSAEAIRVKFPELPGEPAPNTVDPTVIRRVDGSFNWALPPPATPPDCGGK